MCGEIAARHRNRVFSAQIQGDADHDRFAPNGKIVIGAGRLIA